MCLLIAGTAFSLAAQTQSASVYIPPVSGTGIDQRDNTYFYILIYQELSAQDHIITGAYNSSDFSLIGTITPLGADERSSSAMYRFDLFLQDNRTGEITLEQRHRYDKLDTTDVAIKLMIKNVLDQIQATPRNQPLTQPVPQIILPAPLPAQPAPQTVPAAPQPSQPVQTDPQPAQPVQAAPQPVQPVQTAPQPVQTDPQPVQPVTGSGGDWRDKWVFLGASARWIPRIYNGGQETYLSNLGFGLYTEIQILESVALETGLELARDWVRITDSANNEKDYLDLVLEIPVLVKIVIKPGSVFMLEPYAGINFNVPLVGVMKPPPVSWVLGYQHGVKAGPGIFLFDFRFSMDSGNSSLKELPGITYSRNSPSFSAGYKIGIAPKK